MNGRNISYVGYTKNLKNRLRLHNSSKGAKFTRGKNGKLSILRDMILNLKL